VNSETTHYCSGLFVATTAMLAGHLLTRPGLVVGIAAGFYASIVFFFLAANVFGWTLFMRPRS
jgi:hypothetical protein